MEGRGVLEGSEGIEARSMVERMESGEQRMSEEGCGGGGVGLESRRER